MELPSSLQLGLERTVRHACERCGASAGLLLHEKAGYLHPVVGIGLEDLSLSPLPIPGEEAAFPDLPPALRDAFPSWLPVPLFWQGRRTGWLLLGSQEEISHEVEAYPKETFLLDPPAFLLLAWEEAAGREERMRALAEQIRLAEKQSALLQAIGEVSRQALSLLHPTTLLQNVAEALIRHLGYDYAHVLLLEDDTLVLRASAGRSSRAVLGRRLPLGQGITGWVAAVRQPYLCNEVSNDPHYLYIEELSDVHSELAAPIRGQRPSSASWTSRATHPTPLMRRTSWPSLRWPTIWASPWKMPNSTPDCTTVWSNWNRPEAASSRPNASSP